ncbi:histone PARylation factor 1 [Anticarsia gemmatalis]|uniref:histone PARylation factor 1 n=1 Tax=Anticarsia gemmatalis TaxID=129554 RepID=UPI003F75CEF7
MADGWDEYASDPRTVCKYGSKCYQKNPDHHKKFKHPPILRKEANRNKRRYSPYTRNADRQSPSTNSKKLDEEHKSDSEESTNKVKESTNKVEESTNKVENEECKTEVESEETKKLCVDLPKDLTYYDKTTDKSKFKELFLVNMPDDFFKFFEFIDALGTSAEDSLKGVNLELIGPYDLLLGKLPILDDKELYLIHWRYFYDPPEFQAVLKKKSSEYHIGYYRDSPDQDTAFLVSNDSAKGYHITLLSENIFGAVYLYLQNEKKNSPFTAMPCQKLMDKIKEYAEQNNISLTELSMKKRLSQTVTKTFHGAGISVPYNKKTQVGYRRLAETDANLKKIFTNLQNAKSQVEKDKILSDMQVVVTNASIALDECDFGTGLELGIDLFCSGLKELEGIALNNLTTAYGVLMRQPFAQIAKAHMKYRRKGQHMSLLSLQK